MDDPYGIRALIASRMKLAEFARAMRSTPQTVNHWIARGLPGARLFAAADVLGMTVDDLRAFTAEGRRPPADIESDIRAFSRTFSQLTADQQADVIARLERLSRSR